MNSEIISMNCIRKFNQLFSDGFYFASARIQILDYMRIYNTSFISSGFQSYRILRLEYTPFRIDCAKFVWPNKTVHLYVNSIVKINVIT